MANEAVCYETPTKFARYTVADGATIERGTLLKLTTPNTAAACSADNDVFGGVAWSEKVASDGTTEITAALDGVWGMLTSAATITIGNQVTINGANEIKIYSTLDEEKGYVVGKALETISGVATVIKVRLGGC
jgi:hypothetical protein